MMFLTTPNTNNWPRETILSEPPRTLLRLCQFPTGRDSTFDVSDWCKILLVLISDD